ncbi:MAG: methylenetetrahydrofolate reductase [Clostridiales Family XIII bacterium]|jgi:methylenetetrahydrofolate reductase (NADPH)|nr:methylenetetrahydrofolate reductase [Clostridiales Family XIII bacterium]
MKITDILKSKATLSFEVFPPKEGQPMEPLLEALRQLYRLRPDFISCTYGAGGTNKGRNMEICEAIIRDGHVPVSHFTCIGGTKEEIRDVMGGYVSIGIENVLALRGDLPAGWAGTGGDFAHADELLAFLERERPELCKGVAGYPEKHLQAASLEEDIGHLKSKQDKGAAFITTQICHDLEAFSRYLERIRRAGVTIPVVAGIMPVLYREGTIRMTLSNGCSIPRELAEIIGRHDGRPEDFKKAGKEYTARQIQRFKETGAAGLHIYTMNKHEDITEVLAMAGVYAYPSLNSANSAQNYQADA